MTSFRSLKISTKLLALVAVFMVGFGAFGWVAKSTLDAVKVNGPKYEEIIRSQELVADILPPPEYIIEAYLTVLQMENETDPARLQERIRQFQKLKTEYLEHHDVWASKLPQGETRRVLLDDSYRPAVEFFQGVETRFLPALNRGDRDAARKISRGYLAERYETHRAAIDRVVTLADRESKERVQEAGALVATRTNLLLAIGLALVALAAGLCIWIARGIAAQLRKASTQISSISEEFAGTLAEDERMSTHQAVAVNETTTTMEELNASARLSAEQAEAASAGSREALSLADQGRATVSRTLDGITSLKERSSSIAEHILRLSDQTSQIGNITNLVSDLANQTNLLALNAAVEAARAGEHGRGFAVVASEIRKLADQSKKSAERISAILVEIQQATNSTVMATEEGTRTAQQGTQLAHSTGDAFNQLALSVGSAYESAQQIALNAKEQAAAVSQVVAAMNSLNAGAQEAATRTTQTRAGIERLNVAAGELAAMV